MNNTDKKAKLPRLTKSTKLTYAGIIGAVVILFVAAIAIFNIWIFDRTAPLCADEAKITKTIKDYLIAEDEAEQQKHDEEKAKMFVAMRIYSINKSQNKTTVYALISHERYRRDKYTDELVRGGSAWSIPYKVELAKDEDDYVVTKYQAEPTAYRITSIPKSILGKMNREERDGTREKLRLEIQEQVDLYFH